MLTTSQWLSQLDNLLLNANGYNLNDKTKTLIIRHLQGARQALVKSFFEGQQQEKQNQTR